MELIMEKEEYMEILKSSSEKITVEGDIIVPDVKPDVLKVLQVDASSVITDKGIANGAIYVSGKLNVNILYIPDSEEECTGCIKASFEFRDRFELGENYTDAKLKIKSDVAKIDFTLLNSRKLSVKAVVLANYEIIGKNEFEIPCRIEKDNCECLMEKIMCDKISVDDECEFVISDSMEISGAKPCADEILKTDAKIVSTEMKAVSGKLIAKGILSVCILYRTDDMGIDFTKSEFPFTEVFDVYDLEETDKLYLNLEIGDISTELCPDANGEMRSINIEALILADIRAERQNELNIISDCYYPSMKTELMYNTHDLKCLLTDVSEQKSIKETIIPDSKFPEIAKIYNVVSDIETVKVKTQNNSVEIDAKLRIYILYLTNNKKCAVYTIRKDIGINHTMYIDGVREGMTAKARVTPDKLSYNMNSAGEIEVRGTVNFDVKVIEEKRVNLICDVKCFELDKKNDIIIYFVKDGDSLWNIAKRYSVKMSDIISANSLSESQLKKGQKLLIPA